MIAKAGAMTSYWEHYPYQADMEGLLKGAGNAIFTEMTTRNPTDGASAGSQARALSHRVKGAAVTLFPGVRSQTGTMTKTG